MELSEGRTEGLDANARERFAFIEEHTITEKNATTLFSLAYDVIRLYLQARATERNVPFHAHDTLIDRCKERGIIGSETAQTIHEFRKKRNNIEYRAETASVEQTTNIIRFAKTVIA